MNRSIRHEASEWFVEFRSGEPREHTRKAFHAWLTESPAHIAAYLEIAALWNESASLDVTSRWSIESLISQAKADTDAVVALEFPNARKGDLHRLNGPWLRPVYGLAAGALVFLAVVLAGWLYSVRDTYSTAVGEQRSISLSDGSIVELNARTKLRVRYSDEERHVDLIEGQALFTVAKNKNRPFVVESNGALVRAVGTRFDVYRKTSATTVTVLEGTVAVTPARSAARSDPDLVSAGEQVTITPRAVAKKAAATNLGAATAWTHRQLIFDNTPLLEVADELNRYNKRQLIIRDESLQKLAIDGVFASTDPSALVSFLKSRPGVTVHETEGEIVVDAR